MDKVKFALESFRKDKPPAAHLVVAHEPESRANTHAPRFTFDRARLRSKRVVLPEDATPAAAAYKMLRTQALQRIRRAGQRVIGIASAVDGEGKSLTAINLALALAAEPNHNVLLLDLDLRRPSIARVLDIPEGRGIDSCLRGEVSPAEIMWRPEGMQRLSVIPAYAVGTASSELLASERTRIALLELRNRYEDRLIVVDLPPLLLSDDALTLLPLLDAVLLVVAEGRTRREDVARAAELLGTTPRLGTVLNHAHEVQKRVY